jgi:hypothetical protein
MISSKYVAKNIRRKFFWTILLSFQVCSQIWLNNFLDDCHFGYITKSFKKTHPCCYCVHFTAQFPLRLICFIWPTASLAIFVAQVNAIENDGHSVPFSGS